MLWKTKVWYTSSVTSGLFQLRAQHAAVELRRRHAAVLDGLCSSGGTFWNSLSARARVEAAQASSATMYFMAGECVNGRRGAPWRPAVEAHGLLFGLMQQSPHE